jgi:nucleoside-diphosphate-sugar epimerase
MLAASADGASGKTFNIACGERISLNRLLDDLRGIIGVEIEARHLEPRPGDVPHSLADISRAREYLGYEPATDFAEGLRRTVDYLQQQHSSASRALA